MPKGVLSAVLTSPGLATAMHVDWHFPPFEWAFGASRNAALFAYVATGLVAYVVTLIVLRRRRVSLIAGSRL